MIGSSVTARGTSEHLGTVEDVVLDPRNGTVVAFRVRQGFLFAKRRVLLPRDIRSWKHETVEVEGEDSFAIPGEVDQLEQRLRSAFPWVGLRVETANGIFLGHVDDVGIHMDLFQARRIEVTRAVLGIIPLSSSIIAMERVMTVTRRAMIVLDDTAQRARSFRTLEADLPA